MHVAEAEHKRAGGYGRAHGLCGQLHRVLRQSVVAGAHTHPLHEDVLPPSLWRVHGGVGWDGMRIDDAAHIEWRRIPPRGSCNVSGIDLVGTIMQIASCTT
jgi:hypothetical protein